MCTCKPQWSSECYTNKCSVTSYHQEEKLSDTRQPREAEDWAGGVPNTQTCTSTPPRTVTSANTVLKAVGTYP